MSDWASTVGTSLGAIGQEITGNQGAKAAGAAAGAQLDVAKQYGAQMQAQAAPTALELANMNSQLQQTQTQLARQQKMFDAVDPTLMEAGKQALALLKGQSAASVSPMLQQRAQQRQQMMQQLQQQLGPGAESSSAGAAALAQFDLQTSNYQAQLQQGALGTLLGTTQFGAESGMQSGSQAGQFSSLLGQTAGAIQNRQIGATQTAGQMIGSNAGAPWVQKLAEAGNQSQLFGGAPKMAGAIGNSIQNTNWGSMFGSGQPAPGSGAQGSGYGTGTPGMSSPVAGPTQQNGDFLSGQAMAML